MTDDERREMQEWHQRQWQDRAFDTLFGIAERDRKEARDLAARVAEFAARHEPFARALRSELELKRKGRQRGPKPLVTATDDLMLLIHFYLGIFHGDSRAVLYRDLAEKYSLSVGTIKNRVSKAKKGSAKRRAIRLEELPEFMHDVARADWPSSG